MNKNLWRINILSNIAILMLFVDFKTNRHHGCDAKYYAYGVVHVPQKLEYSWEAIETYMNRLGETWVDEKGFLFFLFNTAKWIHTIPEIRRLSPIRLLIWHSLAYQEESRRNLEFSRGCGSTWRSIISIANDIRHILKIRVNWELPPGNVSSV